MSFTLLQLTDLHVLADPQAKVVGIPTWQTLLDVIENIRLQGIRPDHVVITGDHTHDEQPQTYMQLRELLLDWLPRLHVVPGNHDSPELICRTFPEIAPASPPVMFEFSEDDWTFLGLDSHLPGEVSGSVTEPQLIWLDRRLENGTGPAGVFLHHPPVAVDSVWMDQISLQNAARLREVITAHDRVRFVCCGHVHHEFSCQLGNAAVLTTPSTGLQFDPQGEKPTFADAAPGFRLFEFTGPEFTSRVCRLPSVRFHPVVE